MNSREWNKEEFLKTSSYYWQTCTLHTGVKLDLFTIADAGPLSAEEICRKVGGDLRGVSILLNALTAMELLIHEEGEYSNTPAAGRYLSKTSPDYIGYIIMHHHNLLESWRDMDKAVISGKPVRTRSSEATDIERESFLMGMFNLAMSMAPTLAEEIDLSGCRHLLDFGGGPGTYAVHFCLSNPGLEAKVYDLPSSRPFAEKTIEMFKISDRVKFIEGDFIKEEFQCHGEFDAAWLSHILHGEGPEDAEKIIGKAVSALKPGGKIFIHEFLLNNSMDGPLFPALFSINMMVGTEKGQSYSEEQLIIMLKKYEIKDIQRLNFIGPSQSGILAGIV